jgi:hypothetical protein
MLLGSGVRLGGDGASRYPVSHAEVKPAPSLMLVKRKERKEGEEQGKVEEEKRGKKRNSWLGLPPAESHRLWGVQSLLGTPCLRDDLPSPTSPHRALPPH